MKGKRIIVLLIAVISVVTMAFALAACGEDAPTVKTYTVSFDTDGAGSIDPVKVDDGKTVAQPTEPQKDGFVFKGWYNGDAAYDFDTPVKSNIVLKARWNELCTVSFMSDGAEFKSKTAEKGSTVSLTDMPAKAEHIFMYWSESENGNGAPYDFATPVTDDLVLYAKWMNESEAYSMLQSAISVQNLAPYPYTVKFTVSEVSDGELLEYTITYRYVQNAEGGHDVYSIFESSWNTEERYTVFGSDGKDLCRYYKGKDADAFAATGAVWSYDYYMPLKFFEMSADIATGDFYSVEGAFVEDGAYTFGVYAESTPAFEMYIIGTYGKLLLNARVGIKDGKIASVKGDMNGGVQYAIDFDYTRFEQPRPALPESQAEAKKVRNGSGLVGEPISVSALTSLFELKVNGSTVAVTEDMLDIGALDLQNPIGGTYPIKLEYTTWDGVLAQAEATFTVAEKTLKDVLHSEYRNSTFTVGGMTISRNGDVYSYEDGSYGYYLKTDDSEKGYKTAQMAKITKAVTMNKWVRCVRMDLLLGLDADLFDYDESAKTYTFKAVYDKNMPYKNKLQNFFALTTETTTTYLLVKLEDSTKPYSIVVTLDENGNIAKINVSFYTTKQFTFEFDVMANAATPETPPEIINAFTEYTVTYKAGDRAEGEDKEDTANGGSYTVLRYSESSFAWAVQSGFRFVNWKIEGTETYVAGGATHKLNTPDSPSVTFVAQWEEMQKFTVTYRAGEHGTGAEVVKNDVYEGAYTVESPDALSIAATEGFVFDGWLVEGTANTVAAGKSYALASDVVFIAQWKPAFVSGTVYAQAEGAEQAEFSYGSQYAVIVQAEIDVSIMQMKLTYTVSEETQTEVVDLKEDNEYGQSYRLSSSGELKNYFGSDAYIRLSADGSSMQFSAYDYYSEEMHDTGDPYTKQA